MMPSPLSRGSHSVESSTSNRAKPAFLVFAFAWLLVFPWVSFAYRWDIPDNASLLGQLSEDYVTIITTWHESLSRTPSALKEILENTTSPNKLVYVHLDLAFWNDITAEILALQAAEDRLTVICVNEWLDRHSMYNIGLRQAQSRYAVIYDARLKALFPGWIGNLTFAMRHTKPQPVLLSVAGGGGTTDRFHERRSVMNMELYGGRAPSHYPVLVWRNAHGSRLEAPPGHTVMTGDIIEPHSYIVDLGRIGVRDFLSPDISSAIAHVHLALALQRRFGFGAAAVLESMTLQVERPPTHAKVQEVPLYLVRWDSSDCSHSVLHFEKLYSIRYFMGCGFLPRHLPSPFPKASLMNYLAPSSRITLAAMMLGVYSSLPFRLFEFTVEKPRSAADDRAALSKMPLRSAMQWLSDHSDGIGNDWQVTVNVHEENPLETATTNVPKHVETEYAAWVREYLENTTYPLQALSHKAKLAWRYEAALQAAHHSSGENVYFKPHALSIIRTPLKYRERLPQVAEESVVLCDEVEDLCYLIFYLYDALETLRQQLLPELVAEEARLDGSSVKACSVWDACYNLPVVTPTMKVVHWTLHPN